jgi:hypothetical protein
MDKKRKTDWAGWAALIAVSTGILAIAAFWVAAIWIVAHFVIKFW